MKDINKIEEYHYDASPGLGIIFKAKSFLLETNLYTYVISPAKFDEDFKDKIKSTNKDVIVIAPNNFHNIGLSSMKESFPNAKFYGPKRSAKQSGVELINTKNLPNDPEFKAILIEGNKSMSESVFIHNPSESLIVTDIIFNMHHKMNLASTLLFKCYGTYKKVGQSIAIKMTADNKKILIKSLQKLTELNFKNILLNHGDHLSKENFDEFILSLN